MLFIVSSFSYARLNAYLQRALTLDTKNVDALFWLAECHHHYLFDSQKARQYLERALAIDPNRADCLSFMATVLYRLEADPELMLLYINKAIAHEPDWITPRLQRIYLLINREQLPEAEQEIIVVKQLASRKPPLSNETIQEYYESVITGRSSEHIHEHIERYEQTIKMKKN